MADLAAKPWERYGADTSAPWTKYASGEQGAQSAQTKRQFFWDPKTGSVLEATASTPKELIIPGYGELGDGSGNETRAQQKARLDHRYRSRSPFSVTSHDLLDLKRSIAPPVRGTIKAATALPGLAADAGVGIRNTLTGSNYEAPTASMERSLDQFLPLPNIPGDKTLEFLTSVLGGAKLPAPQAKNPVPSNFSRPGQDIVRQETLRQGQDIGLVVPPSTTNPSTFNRFLESLGGKIGTAQDAAARNIKRFTDAGKRALGLSEDAMLTQESIAAIRREAGDAYETLRGAGQIVADQTYDDALKAVAAKYTSAAKEFPTLAKNPLDDVLSEVGKRQFSSDSAVDLLSILRDKTDAAFRAGDKGLGKGLKDVSKAIEDLMERNLTAAGKADLVQKFREARQLIAKTYSVENAFNPSTGNVVGTKLAQQLAKKKPLSGDLRTAARFSQAFPKASSAVDDSGSVRNTDVILGAGAGAVSGEPTLLLYPFLRQAARNFLLSETGQKMATPRGPLNVPPEVIMGLLGGEESLRR